MGQNKLPPPVKLTQADVAINRFTVGIFCAQLLLAIVLGVTGNLSSSPLWYLGGVSNKLQGNDGSFRSWLGESVPAPLVVPLRFLLLNSMMIPISLKAMFNAFFVWAASVCLLSRPSQVTLDLVKLCYSRLIGWDVSMYDPTSDTPASAVNTSIAEDLGRVSHYLASCVRPIDPRCVHWYRSGSCCRTRQGL